MLILVNHARLERAVRYDSYHTVTSQMQHPCFSALWHTVSPTVGCALTHLNWALIRLILCSQNQHEIDTAQSTAENSYQKIQYL